jgi:hypothetical protein
MKSRKLSASISAWLHGLASPSGSRRSRARSCRPKLSSYFRPQLQVLEDRCVLSTTNIGHTISDASLSTKDATEKPSAVVTSTTKGATNAAPGQQLAEIILADSAFSPQGAIVNSNIFFYPGTASFTFVMVPLSRGTNGPQIAQVATYNVVISFPTNSATHATTTFQVSLAVEMNRGIAWWSQTTHPGTNTPVALAGTGPTLSSVPPAQASMPVVVFLPPTSSGTSEDAAPRPMMAVIISALAKELVALEMSKIPGTPKDADHHEAVLNGMQDDRSGLPAPAETQQAASQIPSKATQVQSAPSRAELHALTQKILAEAAPAADAEPDPRIGFSIRALLACAAAESTWLVLRNLATTRAPLPADDEDGHRVEIWKKPK